MEISQFLRKEGSRYFRVLRNKYKEDDYESVLIADSNDICESTYNLYLRC
jgi:hypothetical protein